MANRPILDRYGDYSTQTDPSGQFVVLGEGGFGVTVRASRTENLPGEEFVEEVAIKILREEAFSESKLSRFKKEIHQLRALQHHNLVLYKGCGVEKGCTFLVLELCEGGDLNTLVKRFSRLPERLALQIAHQIAEGLVEVHCRGYVHRDIKPDNILLKEKLPKHATPDWIQYQITSGRFRFKLADFGLAITEEEGRGRGGGFAGTHMFACPEQFREHPLDARSDIYSLGMTLWYMAIGRKPFKEPFGTTNPNPHTRPDPHDVHFPAELSEGFRGLLSRMVRKDPHERFDSARELADAIREQLRAMPAGPNPTSIETEPTPSELDAEWGRGEWSNYYEESSCVRIGRRPVGEYYCARRRGSETAIGLTFWNAANSSESASELTIGRYLQKLRDTTNDPQAPPEIIRILEFHRTEEEWCVAEDWRPSEPLNRFLSARENAVSLEQAAQLLWPVARACEYLQRARTSSQLLLAQGVGALLTVDDVRLASPLANADNSDWLSLPLEEWGEWTVCVSALALPREYSPASQASEASSQSDSVASDMTLRGGTVTVDSASAGEFSLGQSSIVKGFCRLLYRMIEGQEVAVMAGEDPFCYTNAARLGANSNSMLRDYICGRLAEKSPVDILKQICRNEGNLLWPPGASKDSAQTVSVEWSRTSMQASVSRGGSSAIDTATLIPNRPGWVCSPYGEQAEQQIAGEQWEPEAVIPCMATGKAFKLPKRIPDLEAIIVSERCDAVLSSYVEPPVEVPVPIGKWKSRATFACEETGKTLRMPADLPVPVAIAFDDAPGTVELPFRSHPRWAISPDSWQAGAVIADESGQEFALPEQLPVLPAIPHAETGKVESPYEPGRPFELEAMDCLPKRVVRCKWSGNEIRLPENIYDIWHFFGGVRDHGKNEIRSPFVTQDSKAWQQVPIEEWHPGGRLACKETGGFFFLPETLPVLDAQADENSIGTFWSPLCPGPSFTLPGWQCTPLLVIEYPPFGEPHRPVRLPAQFPEGWKWVGAVRQTSDAQPEAQSPLVDPDETSSWMPIEEAQWKPGGTIVCLVSGREFFLPEKLERLRLKPGPKSGTVLCPFPPNRPIAIPATHWKANAAVSLRLTSGTLLEAVLPGELPAREESAPTDSGAQPSAAPATAGSGTKVWHTPTTSQVELEGVEPGLAGRNGKIRSPYGKGPWVSVPPKHWRTGTQIRCPETARTFRLAEGLPPLETRTGRNPRTTTCPYCEKQLTDLTADQLKVGARIVCPHCHGQFIVPNTLPQYEAMVDRNRPGWLASPYDPEHWFSLRSDEFDKWYAGHILICPTTSRQFCLPQSLPEWVAEVTLVPGKSGLVKSPFGAQQEFQVPGVSWQAGGVLRCPETQRKLHLPAPLPPLEAILVPERAGFVQSPYAAAHQTIKVPKVQWKSGSVIRCSQTGRDMVMPAQELPAYPHHSLRFVPIAIGGIVVIGGIVFFAWPKDKPGPAGVLPTPLPTTQPETTPEPVSGGL